MNVSICIPTCNRPELLEECLLGCIGQGDRVLEILVGDDSADNRSTERVAKLQPGSPIPIKYFRNEPPLGQAGNVHRLFMEARGEFISLMHDDDAFVEGAIDHLLSCFADDDTIIAFGKQYVVAEDGAVSLEESEGLNATYYRTADTASVPSDLLTSALVQQFPNNGFVMRASVAKKVGYMECAAFIGGAVDFGFAVRCALAYPNARSYFSDRYTAAYRLTRESVARSPATGDAGYHSFRYVSALPRNIVDGPIVRKWLLDKAPLACYQAIRLGKPAEAASIYFSPLHRGRILSPGGIRRGLLLLGLLASTPGRRLLGRLRRLGEAAGGSAR
jgi:glycosyltransferase involved in cell wall biosynthesis